jgi:flavin reductase (DIM6/NTAB) family NADH-FMN oxidoreductase RutF
VLGADQQNISTHCASSEPGETRFTLGQWGDKNGLPYLRDAQAVFFCQTVRQLIQGTHLIVIGEVDKVLVANEPINPLLYADGRYWKLLEE